MNISTAICERASICPPDCTPSYPVMENMGKREVEFGPFKLDWTNVLETERHFDWFRHIEGTFRVAMGPMYERMVKGCE